MAQQVKLRHIKQIPLLNFVLRMVSIPYLIHTWSALLCCYASASSTVTWLPGMVASTIPTPPPLPPLSNVLMPLWCCPAPLSVWCCTWHGSWVHWKLNGEAHVSIVRWHGSHLAWCLMTTQQLWAWGSICRQLEKKQNIIFSIGDQGKWGRVAATLRPVMEKRWLVESCRAHKFYLQKARFCQCTNLSHCSADFDGGSKLPHATLGGGQSVQGYTPQVGE